MDEGIATPFSHPVRNVQYVDDQASTHRTAAMEHIIPAAFVDAALPAKACTAFVLRYKPRVRFITTPPPRKPCPRRRTLRLSGKRMPSLVPV